MGKYSDELKRLTLDPGARRLGEIADQLSIAIEEIRQRCCSGPDVAARPEPPPQDPKPS